MFRGIGGQPGRNNGPELVEGKTELGGQERTAVGGTIEDGPGRSIRECSDES